MILEIAYLPFFIVALVERRTKDDSFISHSGETVQREGGSTEQGRVCPWCAGPHYLNLTNLPQILLCLEAHVLGALNVPQWALTLWTLVSLLCGR